MFKGESLCAGCVKEHAAIYGGCVEAKMAREIESVRVNQGHNLQ